MSLLTSRLVGPDWDKAIAETHSIMATGRNEMAFICSPKSYPPQKDASRSAPNAVDDEPYQGDQGSEPGSEHQGNADEICARPLPCCGTQAILTNGQWRREHAGDYGDSGR